VLDQLDAGDVLMATRLDRLARSIRDLHNTLPSIAGKDVGFRSEGDLRDGPKDRRPWVELRWDAYEGANCAGTGRYRSRHQPRQFDPKRER
jgi:hypothetical protein